MNKQLLLSAAWLLVFLPAFSQNVAINADGTRPNPNAILDIQSGTKGLLIPRMSSAARLAIPNTRGLLVFDTTTNAVWYNTGAAWLPLASAAVVGAGDSAWLLTGNSNATTGSFLGTTTNIPLNIRVNNQPSGRIDSSRENAYWGYFTGVVDTVGTDNAGFGAFALQSTLNGGFNTATGARAMIFNTSGANNTASGYQSLFANQSGSFNTAIGTQALFANTTASGLTATGYQALYNNTSGTQNTANGYQAMILNTTGTQNVAMGYQALNSNTTGQANVAIGYQAMYSTNGGLSNVAVGSGAMYAGDASACAAIGYYALHNNTFNGSANTAVGYYSMSNNTTGQYNVGVGIYTLGNNTTGIYNTAVGPDCLSANTTGIYNTAVGYLALEQSNGTQNTATGLVSMSFNLTGNENTAYGAVSLTKNTSGNYNCGLGDSALVSNTTGSNNTAVGFMADVASGNLRNATAIGNQAVVDASNKVRIGNSAVTVIEGQVPFTTPSDGRYKFNIREDVKGLDFILKLRPVTYQFDVQRFDAQLMRESGRQSYVVPAAYKEATQMRRSGFVAQEVEKAATASGYDFSGIVRPATDQGHYSLSYEEFVVPLVKAVQEQQQTIADLQRQINELKKLIKK
ncbi:MAG TPA: tail fiber domain-containing protein [Puia sp.]|jgi:hypothetical protein|nr:tail fiber domain-containing protein [Puia sp.]